MAPTSGMSGCAKAALIGGVILVVLILAGAAFFFWGVRRFIGQVEEVAAPDSCEFISDEEAGDVMGVTVTVESSPPHAPSTAVARTATATRGIRVRTDRLTAAA